MAATVYMPIATLTRPGDTTSYTANDLVANSTTAGSVVPIKWATSPVAAGAEIRRVLLHKTSATTTAATFALHFFDAAPTVANGDNGAFQPVSVAAWFGSLSIDMSSGAVAGSSGLIKASTAPSAGPGPIFKPSTLGAYVYGLLEVTGAYAPASGEVFTIKLVMEN